LYLVEVPYLFSNEIKMYPVTLGYDEAKKRIESLLQDGYSSEALVTAVFTAEKMLRRTLRQIIVSAGFTSKAAEKLICSANGLAALKERWTIYEPNNKTLVEIIGNQDWQQISTLSKMRNKLIHGVRVYEPEECQEQAKKMLFTLDCLKQKLDETYGYSGWERLSVRKKSKLHIDPKIKIAQN
jgi:hypothetical protein